MALVRYVCRRLRSRTCLLLLVAGLVVMTIRSRDNGGTHDDARLSERDEFMDRNEPLPHEDSPRHDLPEEKPASPDRNSSIHRFLSAYDIPCDPLKLSAEEAWKVAESWTTSRYVHPDHAPEIGCILHHMATAKIIAVDVGFKGTQNKLTLVLEGGQKVAFKPKWYPRDYIVQGEPYAGHDRHNGEVVSFFLNRILGYNRVPLAVGRRVSLKHDILPVASPKLAETFFKQGNDTCFIGKCMYCKTQQDAACGDGDVMEGTVVLWLAKEWTSFKRWRSPWQRSYIPDVLAVWEKENSYCDAVKAHPDYKTGPRLMDLMDAVLMDYLIGNADRHHYETFTGHEDSMLVMMDNAKSFGNPSHDELSILVPLSQCCRVRESTFRRLKLLSDRVLSVLLQKLSRHDPITPLLTPPHYRAMDRRLQHVLATVDHCLAAAAAASDSDPVLVNDAYSLDSRDVR